MVGGIKADILLTILDNLVQAGKECLNDRLDRLKVILRVGINVAISQVFVRTEEIYKCCRNGAVFTGVVAVAPISSGATNE